MQTCFWRLVALACIGILAAATPIGPVFADGDDDRGDKIRSSITIYGRLPGEPTYPTVASADRSDGLPIPWGALSALAADPEDKDMAYTAYDSFYKASRIFKLDLADFPAVISNEIVLGDADDNTVDCA